MGRQEVNRQGVENGKGEGEGKVWPGEFAGCGFVLFLAGPKIT